MFAARNIVRMGRPVLFGVRFQSSSSSSSSSSAKLLQEKTQKIQKIQQQLHKSRTQQKQGNGVQKQAHGAKDAQGNNGKLGDNSNDKFGNNGNNGNSGNTQAKMVIKRGFSTVEKVPSTINLEPRDVLLDKLYQGYNPLLSPIKPKAKKSSPKILVNIYEDLGFDEGDGFEADDAIDSMLGPKLQISKYIFDKNPEMEAKLKELDSNAKEAKGNTEKTEALFEKRDQADSKRGRARLHFKKNMTKKKVEDAGDDE